MLSEDFVNLVVGSTREAIRQTSRAENIEHSYATLGGDYHDLQEPAKFDRYSLLFFKSIAKHIPKDEERDKITTIIGESIYHHIKEKYGFQIGTSDDLEKIRSNLERVIQYFVESGYIDNAQVVWDRFDEGEWREKGQAHFELVMAEPVILSSAQTLYNEEGFAQHYLSRTIERALGEFSVRGREMKDFNPNNFSSDKVVELWELMKS